MVRDGRATVHSIISRKVTITGFDLSSYRQCMKKWNHAIEVMHEQCRDIGKDRCMMVSSKGPRRYLLGAPLSALWSFTPTFYPITDTGPNSINDD